ncbi:MAG: hypothetical protein V4507_13565, partial [Verrucomicrobiota bacterium]
MSMPIFEKWCWRNPPTFFIPLLLLMALALAYSNSLHGPFVFDDFESIVENPSIRSLPQSILLTSYGGTPVSGRPLLNFSLAVNYSLGGLSVEGFHIVNFGIHLLAMLLLFDFLRRTLTLSSFSDSIRRDASWIAGSIAGLWALHPLQTESVTYIVQRAESLMGFFYLLTLYCFVRSHSSTRATWWLIFSVFFCFCGMGTKEIMVSAPWIVFLYDVIFIERKFQSLWKSRRLYYWGLISSWILLAFLIVSYDKKGDVIGFFGKISFLDYLQTQYWAICHYLKLILWPNPLILDYGTLTITSFDKVFPSFLICFVLGAGLAWLFWRDPHWGFWGVWGAFVLAPTSLIPIHTQTIAEHRV